MVPLIDRAFQVVFFHARPLGQGQKAGGFCQRPLAQTRERRAAALLHHVAKVARQLQLAAAVHYTDLNR